MSKPRKKFTWANGRPVVVEDTEIEPKTFITKLASIRNKYPNAWSVAKVLSTLGGAVGFIVVILEIGGVL